MIKVLHCGDLHLDSPFRSADPGTSAARRNELRGTFTSMMLYAKSNGTELILMAGDVFDADFVTKETVQLAAEEFAALPECRIVIAPGNHDPAGRDSIWERTKFPPNVHIFKSTEPSVFHFDDIGTDVYGFAFTEPFLMKFPMYYTEPEDKSKINIALFHGDTLSPLSRSCPVPPDWFGKSGFDYVALGHIHNSSGIERAGNTYYGYCGCLEGRDYGEPGYKGAVVCEMTKTDGAFFAKCRGVRFSKRRYEADTLDLGGVTTRFAAAERMRGLFAAKKYGSDTSLRLTLTGSVPAGLTFPAEWFRSYCGTGLYALELCDKTVPLLDSEKLENDKTITGAFYRSLLPKLTGGTDEEMRIASDALAVGLAALAGSDLTTSDETEIKS